MRSDKELYSMEKRNSDDQNRKKPNVIVFFTDQQRADSTGVHGNPLDLTPNFDWIARTGTWFSQAATCQPVCAPARSSVQTGLYPTETGVWRNRKHLRPDQKTLAAYFNDAGYATAYIGKWHLAGVRTGRDDWNQEPVPRDLQGGYQYWLGAELPEFTSDEYHPRLFDRDGSPVNLPGYRSDAYVDAAIRYIDAQEKNHPEQPFMLFLSIFEPHQQNHIDTFPAPNGYAERYAGRWTPPDLAGSSEAAAKLGGYWGAVKRVDEGLGRLLDAIKSLRISDETIVFYAADHGCHFKTRNNEYKRSCHESSVRIPCAAVGPGFDRCGQRPELFSVIDIFPTLLDAAGLSLPEGLQGRSVIPHLSGAPAADTGPETDRAREYSAGYPSDCPFEEQFIQISEDKVSRALRTRRWKYAVTAFELDGNEVPAASEYVEEFLYDMDADPWEQQNLIGLPYAERISAALRERLRQRILEVECAEVTIIPAPVQAAADQGQRTLLD